MQLYSACDSYKLYQGNMLDMLDVINPNSIDSIVTDPPYELGFMGKSWDSSGIAFQIETWKKCLQVLKPGGYLLAFGGSRTFHRIAVAIEDAGFEIRDTVLWIYGSGFPKSMNIGLAIDKKNGIESKIIGSSGTMPDFQDAVKKNSINKIGVNDGDRADRKESYVYEAQNEWNGWGTCLKPAYEPIIVARKPCEGTCLDNVLKYGVGGINIDECRVPISEGDIVMLNAKSSKNPTSNYNTNEAKKYGDYALNIATPANEQGRFPANVILTYDDTDKQEVCGGFPQTISSGGSGEKSINGNFKSVYGEYKGGVIPSHLGGLGDSGSASRYFYCAKASKRDRDEGLDAFKMTIGGGMSDTADQSLLTDSGNVRDNMRKNIHPTVKPTSLMQYLIRLVTPNGGTILDPFNGSGSTGKAVMWENRDHNKDYVYIGIEMTDQYLPISQARIEYAMNSTYIGVDIMNGNTQSTVNSNPRVNRLF